MGRTAREYLVPCKTRKVEHSVSGNSCIEKKALQRKISQKTAPLQTRPRIPTRLRSRTAEKVSLCTPVVSARFLFFWRAPYRRSCPQFIEKCQAFFLPHRRIFSAPVLDRHMGQDLRGDCAYLAGRSRGRADTKQGDGEGLENRRFAEGVETLLELPRLIHFRLEHAFTRPKVNNPRGQDVKFSAQRATVHNSAELCCLQGSQMRDAASAPVLEEYQRERHAAWNSFPHCRQLFRVFISGGRPAPLSTS